MWNRPVVRYSLHLFLFLVTLTTTTLAGAEWISGRTFFLGPEGFNWKGTLTTADILKGLAFSLPFLGVLTIHEFGHYFTARFYKVRVTLPYYIPFWFGIISSIGTMGAFIRIKERIFSRKEFFDIGIAGPLAGFIAALPLLWYGFTHLPAPEYIFQIHPEYKTFGANYQDFVYKDSPVNIALGKNLLFMICEKLFVSDPALLPHKYETIHYPYLFAGFLSLFFTALNLLPIGQLDGGHILYGLIGYRNFNRLAPIVFVLFILYAGIGIITPAISYDDLIWYGSIYVFYLFIVFRPIVPSLKLCLILIAAVVVAQYVLAIIFPDTNGYSGWLVFGLLLSRFLGVFHPPAPDERPLSTGRKILGWFSLLVFILCFSPSPFIIE